VFLANNRRPRAAVSVPVIQRMDVLCTWKSNLNLTICVTLLRYVIFQTILPAFVKSCMCTWCYSTRATLCEIPFSQYYVP